MSEVVNLINSLENKLQKLFKKTNDLEQNILELKQELNKSEQNLLLKSQAIADLNDKYNALKITNSLLGSDENKRDTKLKINSLIREIDYCIAQLSD